MVRDLFCQVCYVKYIIFITITAERKFFLKAFSIVLLKTSKTKQHVYRDVTDIPKAKTGSCVDAVYAGLRLATVVKNSTS